MNILNMLGKIISLAMFSLAVMAMQEQSETEEEITEGENQVNKMLVTYLLSPGDNKEKNDSFIYENPKKDKIICKFCGKKYKDNISYSRHLKRVHWRNFIDIKDDNIRTNYIPKKNANVKTVPTYFFVKDKISKKVDHQSHLCPRCTQTFRNDLRYRRHLLTCKK